MLWTMRTLKDGCKHISLQLEEAERIVKQLQQAMKAGGGNAYVSFLPDTQGSRDKMQPASKVRNLMDDMSAPMPYTGVKAGLGHGTCPLHRSNSL